MARRGGVLLVRAMSRVVLAGASGLIGSALTRAIRGEGFEVRRLVRRPPSAPDEAFWDPGKGVLDPRVLEGAAAAVNLAGRSLAPGRWTAAVRREIVASRVQSARLLVETIGRTAARPPAFISASAIGYYGDRGDELLTESSPPGRGFLADLVQAWEAEARQAEALGVRVACTRFGLVLARGGGALRPLSLAFRLGLGGPLGSGHQWWSWVHLDDVVGAILMALGNPALDGPVNVVAPEPVTNRDFARTLGAALRRPAVIPAPAFALRLLLGAAADEMLLASQRVHPTRLQEAGFAFRWPSLRPALVDLASRGVD